MRNEYLAFRRQYEPENIRLVVIAESPPASGSIFCNLEGVPGEPLFAAMMGQLDHPPSERLHPLSAGAF
jgi:hypothetical protein